MALGTSQEQVRRDALVDEVAGLARAAGGEAFEGFVRAYYRRTPLEDLRAASPADLCGAARSHWDLARERHPGRPAIRVYTPRSDADGWQSPHSVVEIVDDDLPFLVDSVRMALTRHGLGMHLVVHATLEREAPGSAGTPGHEAPAEAFVHVEFDRQPDPAVLASLEADLRRVEADVRAAADDWPAMLDALHDAATELEAPPAGAPQAATAPQAAGDTPAGDSSAERSEAAAFLRWLAGGHFTFLGYREYELLDGGPRPLAGTGLGILRDRPPDDVAADPPAVAADGASGPRARAGAARPDEVLVLTKASSRSTVHRPSHLDYVGVTRYDSEGRAVGERRFLGLYTSVVYDTHPAEIPVVRRKVRAALERSGLPPSSHEGRELREVLETFPRDELFEVTCDELSTTAMGIADLQERQRVRLFLRHDRYGRFCSCLVYVPRDRLDTATQRRIDRVLVDCLGGTSHEDYVYLPESVLARLHVLVYLPPGARPRLDVAAIERRLAEATRTWADDLRQALVAELGEARGLELHRRYQGAFPPGYRDDFPARAALADIRRLEGLDPGGDLQVSLYHPPEAPPGTARLKLYRSGGPLLVSSLLPRLEHMGVLVLDERPYEIRPSGGPRRWLYDFGLRAGRVAQLDGAQARERFQEAFLAVWAGSADDDGFNRLVVRAGLGWAEVAVLRAYARYLRQAGSASSATYAEEALVSHPDVACLLVQLFAARFDPDRAAGEQREADCAALAGQASTAIDKVAGLEEDRILRALLGLVQATVRTNAYQVGAGGGRPPYLALKLDPSRVADLPRPRPLWEIFVCNPRMEGIHLRGGRVSRGGIRWSDRREDFRTEVLGLMKAQMVKNAVIVPVGSKGGFVVEHPPEEPEALAGEVLSCYRTLISGMLDLTDNLVGGRTVHPERVVRHDGDDTYLVVAADKGTATFSDTANGIALEAGYWLGDAFASGGSTGYDHKAMGITAMGAWESVRRHFAQVGVDPDSDELSVVGIGDMSGDVFGNGMLLSRHLRLVAAFDHRHVFIDPNPDPEASFLERRRLFTMERSCWDDYDRSALSPGGGIYPRSAKSVTLSLEAQAALGVDADVLTPDEVVRAILRAPVDLLWNGGIGTYVKASSERDADVGDKHNDPVRVDARDLRCRVVAEGGNLGFTQRGRVELALAGGMVNTDAIDNSAGVDCSDHEVNLKILLDVMVAAGELTTGQRNDLLASMASDVVELVLAHNRSQTQALANASAEAASLVDVHRRYLRSMEQAGLIDRALEALPGDEELAERKSGGLGLTSPELAVVLAYTKNILYRDLLASDLPDDPDMEGELARYFPARLREAAGGRLAAHPLRREIVANQVCNELVDRQGTTFVHRLGDETGGPAEVARAWLVARDVLGARDLWSEVESPDSGLGGPERTALLLEMRKELGRATRWLLHHRRCAVAVAAEVERFAPGARELAALLPGLLAGTGWSGWDASEEGSGPAERTPALARRVALLEPLCAVFDLVEVAGEAGSPLAEAAAVHVALGVRLGLTWLGERVVALPRAGRWQNLARDALRQDLARQHRAMVRAVLLHSPAGDAGERVEAYLSAGGAALARAERVLGDLRSGPPADLAMLTVALRRLEALA